MQVHRYANVKRPSKSYVASVVFSLDGTVAASGGEQVALWDTGNGEKCCILKGHERHVTAVAFLPDGKTLASADWYGIRFWNIDDKKQESVIRFGGWIPCMGISRDGNNLVTGIAYTLQRWTIADLQHRETYALADDCWSISFCPAGKTLACASGSAIEICTVEPFAIRHELQKHAGRVWSVAFSPDGKTLASGSEDCSIKLWSLKSYSETTHIGGAHENGVNCVCFSPDGRLLASGGNDGTAKIWNWESGKVLATLSVGPATGRPRRSTTRVRSISFSPDGRRLVIGGSGPSHLQFWTLEDDKKNGLY